MGVPPDRMGPYELVRKLGRGGMAETFLARRRGPGGFEQECCLKCVLSQFADDPDFRDQFLDEATLHGRLTHGNIVRVEDFGEHEGTYFLVMEFVDGCDLAQLLEHFGRSGEALPMPLAVLIATDLCQALRYAHGLETDSGPLQIVHRDLTPSNVLISRSGEVKLSDFGIARAAQRRHRTQTGYTKGKFSYMSPEQIEAARDLDGRSDLFALGCVLYEMLAGRRAFEAAGGNDLSVLPRILEGDFTPLAARRPDLDAVLTDTVDRLLQRARDDRPQDAREVLAALAPWVPQVMARERLAALVEHVAGARRPSVPSGATVLQSRLHQRVPTKAAYYAEPTQTNPLRPEPEDALASELWAAPTRRTFRPSLLGVALVLLGAGAAVWGASPWLRVRDHGAAALRRASQGSLPEAETREVSLPQPTPGEVDLGEVDSPEPPADPDPLAQQERAPVAAHSSSALAPPARRARPARRAAEAHEKPEDALGQVELRVVVIPYGNIWIDGERRGSTRADLTLPAGPHRIGVGRGDVPTQHDDVKLSPGRRTLEYELEGAFH